MPAVSGILALPEHESGQIIPQKKPRNTKIILLGPMYFAGNSYLCSTNSPGWWNLVYTYVSEAYAARLASSSLAPGTQKAPMKVGAFLF